MRRRPFLAAALIVLACGAILRTVWLTSDPPAPPRVGISWHDEGAWVHNARNRQLWGVWRTDNWNPVFLTPVFTGLEYAAFTTLGVGTWQARAVPALSGLVAIAFLIAGLNAMTGPRVALHGGALLAVNYAWIMWNRAALMESTMTAFIVISWAAYALAQKRPAWGLVSGAAAVLAFFTKASAAFFIAAIVCEAVIAWRLDRPTSRARRLTPVRRTLAGLAGAGAAIALLFVVPHWPEFRFYNWQMSVVRKPEYSAQAFLRNASWLPIVHDLFTWMWPVFAAASVGIVRVATVWRTARPAARLLVLWVLIGLLELVVHDSGNVRRYVMFLPALIALGVDLLGGVSPQETEGRGDRKTGRLPVCLLVLAFGYLVAASGIRAAFLDQVREGHYHVTVVAAVVAAVMAAAMTFLRWKPCSQWLRGGRVLPWLASTAVVLTVLFDLGHFAGWARTRSSWNHEASREIGRLLAPGTLVHGKLANGLALENRIRPIFIGHGFGNYDDRLQRDDVRYILTYVSPSEGYESQAASNMIGEILDRYPHRRTIATLTVNETGGPDRAALIDKVPGK